jgi:Uma2 family endonuclease
VKTVILGDRPPEIDAFLARRRALDQDRSDEVWEGDYHVVPAPHPWHSHIDSQLGRLLGPPADAAGLVGLSEFNLGTSVDDFRVPDSGYVRGEVPDQVFVPTAAIVVEILSPGDETWEKFPFFARHGVEELCIVDPPDRRVRWFALAGDAYEETAASAVLGVTAEELEASIDWPG